MERCLTRRPSERHLFFAVESGKLQDVKQMLSTLTVNPRDKNGITLLHRAARSGQTSVVHYLVSSCRFKPTATDKYGWTALHWATWCGHYEVAQSLIKSGSGKDPSGGSIVKCIDKTGSTPLHLACLQGHDKLVTLLVTEKCDINLARKDGWCALHLAVWNGHISVVQELLRHGANVNEHTTEGMGATHFAAKKGYVDILKCLLEEGKAAIDMQDKNGNTPLHEAVKEGCTLVTKLLVDKECRVNVKNKSGQTPMDIATANGFSDIIILLSGLQSVLPSIPSVSCANSEDLKLLMMRVDANCTIRNTDLRKYTTPGLGGLGSKLSRGNGGSFRNKSTRQLKRPSINDMWEDTVRSSANGVIVNYEQRIKEIENEHSYRSGLPSGGKESPRSLQNVSALVHERSLPSTPRVPSAPTNGDRMRHQMSLQQSLLSL